jgi:hypothetical protein
LSPASIAARVKALIIAFPPAALPHGCARPCSHLRTPDSRQRRSDSCSASSFRPEFYTTLGIDWVNDNGPSGGQWEQGESNGKRREVMPMKRVLMMRTIPELRPELEHVVNAFDPWARDRGEYYSLAWKPRPDAVTDTSFQGP